MGRIQDTAWAHFPTEDERDALSYQIRKQKKLAKTEPKMIRLASRFSTFISIVIIKSYITQPSFRGKRIKSKLDQNV